MTTTSNSVADGIQRLLALKEIEADVAVLRDDIVALFAALTTERDRVRHALSATTVAEMIDRLTKAADIYDPADDYLIQAAHVIGGAR